MTHQLPILLNSTARRTSANLALVVTVLGCLACSGSRPQPPSPAAAPAGAAPAVVSDAASKELAGWLPSPGPGWSRPAPPRRYGPGNLWEYIDGAAEAYLAHAFQELVTVDVVDATGLRVTVDLFRMETPLGAFGIYSQESNPAAQYLPIGGEAYRSANTLNFWSGTCYAKLTGSKNDATVGAALESLAREVAGRIGSAATRPTEFDRFPAASLVAHSFRTVPHDVLGQSYLAGGFEAEYAEGTARFKVTLIPFATPDEAADAFSRYRTFAGATRAPTPVPGLGQAAFSAADSYYGLVVAARSGRAMAVVLGAPSQKHARALLLPLL